MAISDNFVIQYLLQETRSIDSPIQWQETDDDGYIASLNGVHIEFNNIPTRTGSHFCVTFSCALNQCLTEKVQVLEPVKSGVFHPAYDSEDDHHLAELLRELSLAIRRQVYDRKRSRARSESAIREILFQRLLGHARVVKS
jgi:hypothetical protein